MQPVHQQLAQMVLQMYSCSRQPKATILINSNVIKCCRESAETCLHQPLIKPLFTSKEPQETLMRHEFWQIHHQSKDPLPQSEAACHPGSSWMNVILAQHLASHLLGELSWNPTVTQGKFKHPPACFCTPDLLSWSPPQHSIFPFLLMRDAYEQSQKNP